jgi:hypothetical protein
MFSKIGGFFTGTKKEEKVTTQVDYDRSNGVFKCDKMNDSEYANYTELIENPQKLNELFLINILSNWTYSNMSDEFRPDFASSTGGIGITYFNFRINE